MNRPICHWTHPVPPRHLPIHPPFQHIYPFQQPEMSRRQQTFNRKDYGNAPFTINIQEATQQNNLFRTALWTGNHLQVTLMTIDVGDSVGLEMHHDVDQFLQIEEGQGLVQMGNHEHQLDFVRQVAPHSAIIVPAGIWHNLTNIGNTPLKLFSIYTPPEHPKGTIHLTKADAIAADHEH